MATTDDWAALDFHDCSTCGTSMPFELLDCLDDHGDDCPDRVCTGCGYAVVVGPGPLLVRRRA